MGKLDRLVLPPIAVSATGMGGKGEESRAPPTRSRIWVHAHIHVHTYTHTRSYAQLQKPRRARVSVSVWSDDARTHARTHRTHARAQILDIVGDVHLASQFLVRLVRGSRVYACTLVPFPYEAL